MLLLNPVQIAAKIFYFDLTWMIMIHVLLLGFIFKGYKYNQEAITRLEGVILVVFYLALLVINSMWN